MILFIIGDNMLENAKTSEEYDKIASSILKKCDKIDGISNILTNAINFVNDKQIGIIPEIITSKLNNQKSELENIKDDIISASTLVRNHSNLLQGSGSVSQEIDAK